MRLKNWKMKPILRRRNKVRSRSPSAVSSCPPTQIRPASGASMPLTRLSSVLLPLPLRPSSAMNSPWAKSAEASSKTTRRRSPSR